MFKCCKVFDFKKRIISQSLVHQEATVILTVAHYQMFELDIFSKERVSASWSNPV